MNLQELAKQCYKDTWRWFPDTADDLFFMAAAAAGEAGEALNEAKKVYRGSASRGQAREKILEETTDILVYLLNIFAILEADPEWWYNKVREKNIARFEPVFTKVKDNPQA